VAAVLKCGNKGKKIKGSGLEMKTKRAEQVATADGGRLVGFRGIMRSRPPLLSFGVPLHKMNCAGIPSARRSLIQAVFGVEEALR
jgi:hypothetical protein